MIFTRRENINLNIIFHLLGLLLLIEAAFMCIPLIVCYIYSEYQDANVFLLSAGITAFTGLMMILLTKSHNNDMGKREGLLLTMLTWAVFSLFGMIPFILGSSHLDVASAYFETMSGFTTTGVSAITSVEDVSHGILMWRAVTHLVGGMGIILFTLAVIPMLNKQSGIQLFNAEVTGITHDKVRPRISHTAKSLWMVYVVLSTTLILLLWLGPMNLFDSICHAFSAISTGGFANKNASIDAYHSEYVKIVLSVFMFLSGANFALLYNAAMGNFKSLLKNDTLKWYLWITLGAFAIILLHLLFAKETNDYAGLVIDTLFQTITAITTTGFVGTYYAHWQGVAVIVLTAIMILGSCAGSTSGGVKIDRLVVIMRNLRNELYKLLHPNTITAVRVNGKVLSPSLITKTGAFFVLYTLLVFIGISILVETGMPLFDALFACISCTSNVGLGYGETLSSYAEVTDIGKWTLSTLMLFGRLEIFTIMIIFTRQFWNKE